MYDIYSNPLTTRYASKRMQQIFSENNRIGYFRKLWIALAESEKELGLDITQEQIDELKNNIFPINFDVANAREKEVRHDVMAHIHAYGVQCPKAAPIIHLGATSCFVTDNADLIVYHEALTLLRLKVVAVMDKLSQFADKYKSLPCLGFTHFQPAQLVTVGKRASLWLQDFLLDYHNINDFLNSFRLRGLKGATGTQASFMQLFNNDSEKVIELEKRVAKKLGFLSYFTVSGQTYTRKYDYNILSLLSMIAQSACKFSNDIRLLQNKKEIEEPFEKNQIGSSAMAYKRNPMRSERIASLSRYLISLPVNTAMTACTQWLERTLDDSANRRIVMGQAFLAADAILDLMLNVVDGLVVYEKVIKKHIDEELPFMATEAILMECVKAGGDRQKLHEVIRTHSMEAARLVKLEGETNRLIEMIKNDKAFTTVHDTLDDLMKAENFIGRAVEQTEELITEVKEITNIYPESKNLSAIIEK